MYVQTVTAEGRLVTGLLLFVPGVLQGSNYDNTMGHKNTYVCLMRTSEGLVSQHAHKT